MNEVLLSSLIDKVDEQDRRIEDIKKKVEQMPVYEEVLNRLETGIEGLRTEVHKISFPESAMFELSERLATSIELLKHPVEKKIVHHHHIKNFIWIAAVLFLALCLVSTGWFITYNNLQHFKANDTKYRYLKLISNVSLTKQLRFIDSICEADPEMREFVIAKEEQNQKDFETMQKALQMEKNAKELRKKVAKKGK